MARESILERIVAERVGQTLVGGVSTAIDRIAEEIAKEALQDEAFRRSLKELVQRRSQAILEELLGNGSASRGSQRKKKAQK